MQDLLLAVSSRQLLQAYANNLKGSLLISGPIEADLDQAVQYLRSLIYGQQLGGPEHVHILPSGTIGAIREVITNLSTGRFDASQPRLIIIHQCQNLSLDASNALLKTLEEPPTNSHFILTCEHLQAVLATIRSRCQTISLRRPAKEVIFKHWADQNQLRLQQAYLAASGWPSLMADYLNNPNSLINQEIVLAKEFLIKDKEDRLRYLFANKQSNESDFKDKLHQILSGLRRVCRSSLLHVASRGEITKINSWRYRFLVTNDLYNDLQAQLNPKLVALCLITKI